MFSSTSARSKGPGLNRSPKAIEWSSRLSRAKRVRKQLTLLSRPNLAPDGMQSAPVNSPGRSAFARQCSLRLSRRSLGSEDLELSQLRRIVCTSVRRRIAARAHEVRRLVIEAKRLDGSNHRPSAPSRDQHRFLAHLTRQRAGERMLKEIENLLCISR